MLVTATQVGFYVKLRKPGEQFDVRDDAFSQKWMKRVVVEAPAEVPEPEPVETPDVETVAIGEPQMIPAPVVKKRRGRKPKAVSE